MDSWKTVKLSNICRFENGDRGKNYPGRKAFVTEGIPFINAGHLTENGIDMDGMNFIPKEKFDLLSNGKIQHGDILFCLRGSLGKFAVVEGLQEGAIASSLVIVRPEKVIDRYFLAAYFSSSLCMNMIRKFENGAAQPNLSARSLGEFELPLPPLPEQERIVAILDEAFAAIATATANAEKNLANARELFESELNAVFSQKGDGWVENTLGEVCSFHGGSQPPKSEFSSELKDGYIRLIQIRDYKTDRHIVYIPKEKARRFCSADDVMIGRYGPPLFQILRGIDGAYNVALMKAEPNEEFISKDFIYYFLKNSEILRYIINASNRAAGQIGLNKATLEPYPIAFPSKKKQSEIVLRMQDFKEKAQCLEEIYQQKLTCLAELKQSILQKAFTGELTANPDKILTEVVL